MQSETPAIEALRDPAELSFEEALEELEGLTSRMAAGDMTLDESVRAYERGARLLGRCRSELGRAKEAIERIRVENPMLDEASTVRSAETAPF